MVSLLSSERKIFHGEIGHIIQAGLLRIDPQMLHFGPEKNILAK